MSGFLLDTNAVSELVSVKPNQHVWIGWKPPMRIDSSQRDDSW
jgi:hypothetical protein